MAKPPSRIQNILTVLNGGFDFSKDIKPKPITPQPRVVSDVERDRLLQVSVQSEKPRNLLITGSQSGLLLHMQKMLRSVAHDKIENESILDMSPEVRQAASIMVPSILSPNDLRNSAITITSNCDKIGEKKNAAIGALLTKFFEEHLNFSTMIPHWIHQALYVTGSKPVLILPLVTLEQQLTTGSHVITSQEAYGEKIKRYEQLSLYGIGDGHSVHKSSDIANARILAATEAFGDRHLPTLVGEVLPSTRPAADKVQKTKAYETLIKSVLATESLGVIDNPSAMQFSQTQTKEARKKITEKTRLRYKDAAMLAVEKPEDKSKPIDHPIYMQLPSEAVIPIYTPGSPNDHIGYFILLDDFGHPLEITPDMMNSIDDQQQYSPNQTTFQQLFQAYGMTDFLNGDSQGQAAMADLYQNIVETHLKERLSHGGFSDIEVGRANNVYRYMFSRYLQQRRTKLLFVPKDLLIYFCFKYNEYGVGESKLNELKFILALRISLMVCRSLVAFNNAIDRRRIDVNFDANFTGNVIEHLKTVQREAMRKSAVSFTHDPMSIAQQIVNKSYTVRAKGVSGLPEYSIESEPNQRNDVAPDEQLAEDLKNQLILMMEVPAAAMNNLGEAEYSRSVATTNLFFARATLAKQKIVATHVDNFVQTFTLYSAKLQAELLEIINTKHNDGITPEGTTNETDQQLLEEIIKGLHIRLPPPNVAPDKAQFEALNEMLASLDTILAAVLNDDIASGNQELGQVIGNLRGATKAQMIQKYVQDFGFGDMEIPNIDDLSANDFIKLHHTLNNIAKGIKSQTAVLGVQPEDQALGGGMGGGFGAPGGDMGGGMGDAAMGPEFATEPEPGETPPEDGGPAPPFPNDDTTSPGSF